MSFVKNSLEEGFAVTTKVMADPDFLKSIENSIEFFTTAFKNGNKVFSCGNGGSLCDSMHFAEELTGRYRKDRAPLPATSIIDPSHISCVSNDFGYEYIFSRYLEAWCGSGDVVLAISTSGNSENVIKATEVAKAKGAKVIGLLGKSGGKLKDMADIAIIVPSEVTDRIQEIHIKCIHIFIEGIERNLFPENY
jgi:D-sedoheptulose 7-phosphate isomerase